MGAEPLEEQLVLLTTESPLQSSDPFLDSFGQVSSQAPGLYKMQYGISKHNNLGIS